MPRIPFTTATASEMAKRSVAARVANRIARLSEAKNPPNPALLAIEQSNSSRADALTRVLKQLDSIDKLLMKADSAKDWDMLTRAKERLAKVWFHLGGIPGPGQHKPDAPRRLKVNVFPTVLPEPVSEEPTTGGVPDSINQPIVVSDSNDNPAK